MGMNTTRTAEAARNAKKIAAQYKLIAQLQAEGDSLANRIAVRDCLARIDMYNAAAGL